jgi:hypothetical protein
MCDTERNLLRAAARYLEEDGFPGVEFSIVLECTRPGTLRRYRTRVDCHHYDRSALAEAPLPTRNDDGWIDFSPGEMEILAHLPVENEECITFDKLAELCQEIPEGDIRAVCRNMQKRGLLEIKRGLGCHRCSSTPAV